MIDRVAAAGTVDQVTATLQAFVDAGARHLVFTPMVRGDARRAARPRSWLTCSPASASPP